MANDKPIKPEYIISLRRNGKINLNISNEPFKINKKRVKFNWFKL